MNMTAEIEKLVEQTFPGISREYIRTVSAMVDYVLANESLTQIISSAFMDTNKMRIFPRSGYTFDTMICVFSDQFDIDLRSEWEDFIRDELDADGWSGAAYSIYVQATQQVIFRKMGIEYAGDSSFLMDYQSLMADESLTPFQRRVAQEMYLRRIGNE